jgi:HEAT repeat protein
MRFLVAATFVLSLVPISAFAADDPDETIIKNGGISVEGPALLDFVKQRSRESVPADELTPFLKALSSTDAKAAEAGAAALIARGPLSVPSLRKAVNDLADKTLAERARKCLTFIEGRPGADLAAAIARLIGTKKPAGSVEVLLAYLPYADDASVLDAVGMTLGNLAYPEGKAHAALLKAIESEIPVLRATAVEALSKTDHPETRPAIAKRLGDSAIPVKQRAALALARVEDVAAIPVLVELMGELNKSERVPVDEMLRSLAGETAPKDMPAGDDEKDRKTLKAGWDGWWKKVDGSALVDEFRTRTLDPSDRPKVAELIKKLGDGNYRVREKASQDLASMGAKVLADLRVAARDADSERSKRAEEAITRINSNDTKRVPMASARLVALRRPAGAAEAMLNYLPYADDDDGMIYEVKAALTTLALDPNGRPDPALLKALTDAHPARRMAAAEALAKGGGLAVRGDVKKLLADTDPLVRQAAAAALVLSGERDAVPILIDVLGELSPTQIWPAQDVLHQLAGEKAPTTLVGDKPDERKKYRDDWASWWKANAMSTDLAKLTTSPGYLGYTLLIEVGNNSVGRVTEIGRDGKARWQIKELRYPVDAFVLHGERVLITEWEGSRVAEWDTRGNIVWKKENLPSRPTNSQRLANGNTFISMTNEVMEVDRTGRTIYQIKVNQGLTAGYRATNGEIVCLRNDGKCVRYDTTGKEIKSFASNRDTSWTSGIDLVRNGNVLITQPNPNQKVTEYTSDGKMVKEWSTPQITTATKLTNGNILASSHNDSKVIEFDPSGKKVWEHKSDLHIFRAKRR